MRIYMENKYIYTLVFLAILTVVIIVILKFTLKEESRPNYS